MIYGAAKNVSRECSVHGNEEKIASSRFTDCILSVILSRMQVCFLVVISMVGIYK